MLGRNPMKIATRVFLLGCLLNSIVPAFAQEDGSLAQNVRQGPDQTIRSNAGLNAVGGSLQDTDGVDRIALAKAWLGGDYFNEHLNAVAGKII